MDAREGPQYAPAFLFQNIYVELHLVFALHTVFLLIDVLRGLFNGCGAIEDTDFTIFQETFLLLH